MTLAATPTAARRDAPMPESPRSIRVPGADGLSLHALDWTPEGASPLATALFLHGFGHSARVWDDVIPFLPAGFRILAIDHRGHG